MRAVFVNYHVDPANAEASEAIPEVVFRGVVGWLPAFWMPREAGYAVATTVEHLQQPGAAKPVAPITVMLRGVEIEVDDIGRGEHCLYAWRRTVRYYITLCHRGGPARMMGPGRNYSAAGKGRSSL